MINQTAERSELLRLDHISYRYETGELALDDVSAAVYAGEKIAVLGNNGAGKSTFFLCCNGVLEPAGGGVFYRGEKIDHHHRRSLVTLRRNVGLVFQDPDNQMIASTVESEISFGPMNLGLEAQEVGARVDRAIACMELENFRSRPPHYLSGGEKKRVSIADILAMEPEIILFDEPAASLDPRNAAMLEQTLQNLSESGMALVVSTHDVDFAWRWADRILVFNEAHIAADGSPESVFANGALLEKAGLRKPQIYAFAEIACMAGEKPLPDRMPKTEQEFEKLIRSLY